MPKKSSPPTKVAASKKAPLKKTASAKKGGATVQDDKREWELSRAFGLNWDRKHARSAVDAHLDIDVDGKAYRFPVEVKSTTSGTVATARDFGPDHLERWRRMLFVIGFYSTEAGEPDLMYSLCLTPLDLEPWIAGIEEKTGIDFKLAARASQKLELDDLFDVCGQQDTYSMQDAQRLHKQQWKVAEYAEALDTEVDGVPRVSQQKMLEILRLRAKYIAERGSTLNNPHINKGDLAGFWGTDREVQLTQEAGAIRRIATDFVRDHPAHAAVVEAAKLRAADAIPLKT